MKMGAAVVSIAIFSTASYCRAEPVRELVQEALFRAGEQGYHTFRIPAIVVTKKGTLLAFCEGRKEGSGDSGNIDLVLKRSFDGGQTWQPLELVADEGPNTIGNPCPVVDQSTGTIWLPLTHNLGSDKEDAIKSGTGQGSRTVWITRSDDDGATWSPLAEITSTTKEPNWGWYATGPGCGIQLESGRLVIPCDHRLVRSDVLRSHIIYSDNYGESWKLGGLLGDKTNECQVVELADQSLLLNMRSYHGRKCRAIATSRDGGLTWSDVTLDESLVDPVCQASLLRYTTQSRHGKNRLLFSNPANTRREKLTVRISYDEGKSWSAGKQLHAGPAAYSALVVLPDMTIGCLYERGQQRAYETITFARFPLSWLTDGQDSIRP